MRVMQVRLVVLSMALAMIPTGVWAQAKPAGVAEKAQSEKTKSDKPVAKPNFSGVWTLDKSRSDYGRLPPPASQTRTIDHKDPDLKLKTVTTGSFGEVTTEYNYKTNGEPASDTIRGSKVSHTSKWEEGTLSIAFERALPNGSVAKSTEKWFLSEDGKTLMSVNKSLTSNGDELTITAVFSKQ
jgi:hypothetical protein